MSRVRTIVLVIAAVFGISYTLLAASFLSGGKRDVGPIESIDGIPFPKDGGAFRILETLAHMDVYLQEPVLAKKLMMAITFDPKDMEEIRVGVRHSGFWLSYEPQILWNASFPPGEQTRFIEIPLTDKFQEPDRSIDIMFFGLKSGTGTDVDLGVDDPTDWELIHAAVAVAPDQPTWKSLKDYARSVLERERAL